MLVGVIDVAPGTRWPVVDLHDRDELIYVVSGEVIEGHQRYGAATYLGAGHFIVGPNREQLVELARLADRGEVRPTIDAVFPPRKARQAFERSPGDSRRGKGKIVLRVVEKP